MMPVIEAETPVRPSVRIRVIPAMRAVSVTMAASSCVRDPFKPL
jgi:hypothetical protein